jgi:ATP-binding cassette subfamily F protein uup
VLDEPTNDLDMDTLDLLEDLLAVYVGPLILVSHDGVFIDRLATSSIAVVGAGRAVESRGGWCDFLGLSPGFGRGFVGAAPEPGASAAEVCA